MADGSDSVLGQCASLAEQIYGTHSHYTARVNASGGFKDNLSLIHIYLQIVIAFYGVYNYKQK